MKFFISGGSGYLGRNLIRHLQQEDCAYKNYDIALGYDILDEQKLFREMKGCDAVFHLAALKSVTYCERNVEEAIDVNVLGTRAITDVANILQLPVVFASTMAAKTVHNVYGLTKRLAEILVLKVNGVVLRLSNIYGGTSFLLEGHTAMANFIRRKKAGFKAEIFGDGSAERHFLHVDDACRAFIMALGAEPGIYEIQCGKPVSIKELADMIGIECDYFPSRVGDIDRIKGEPNYESLGWAPIVSLEDGIKEMMKEK